MTSRDRMTRAEDYVFGLMNEQERARAERDMQVDPEFREYVTVLAERLRRLHRTREGSPVADTDWNEITTRLSQMPQMGGGDVGTRMAGFGLPAPDGEAKGLLRIRRPGAQQLAGWRGTVVALALAAAMVAGYIAGQATAPVPDPVAAVLLSQQDTQPSAMLEIHPGNAVRFVPLAAMEVPDGKVLQLWTWLREDPIPLGTLSAPVATTMQGPEMPLPEQGQLFDVTVENAPGSATGRPSGSSILSGKAVVPAR